GDPFAGLAAGYPRAWSCLAALRAALLSGGGRISYRLPEALVPALPEASEVTGALHAEHVELSPGSSPAVVLSGIDPRFDQAMFQLLQEAGSGPMVIGLPGLSRISRNSGKLLRVLEFLLARQAAVLTTNYLLTGKEVSVRQRDLVRPDSRSPGNGFQDTSGLTGSHRKTVEAYVRQVSQPAAQPPSARTIAHAGEEP
nr:hypothetical protein [Actinomycetota bacterium]